MRLLAFTLIYFVAGISVPSALMAAGAPDAREGKARDHLKQRVSRESGGILEVSKFAKTNGYDKVLEGTKMYVLEWSAEVAARQKIWKPGNMIAGYWEDFGVFTQEPGAMDSLLTGGAQHFPAGTTFRLSGNTLFRLTDLGWRPEQASVISWKAIADTPKPNSKSAFVGVWRLLEECEDCMKAEEAARITEMSSGLFKLETGFFDSSGRPKFDSQFAPAPETLRLESGKLTGTSTRDRVSRPVRVEIGSDGQLTYFWGDFLPKKGPKVP